MCVSVDVCVYIYVKVSKVSEAVTHEDSKRQNMCRVCVCVCVLARVCMLVFACVCMCLC